MIYQYEEKVVNRSNDFLDKDNFIGYILPNGSIFSCENHNVSNVDTFLKMYLVLLDEDISKKDELLNIETDNELAKIILVYLKKMSHDEIHALLEFTRKESTTIKDLLVSLFGCHLITRLKKEILTSEIDHTCFYNYLLHDFKIMSLSKLVYDKDSKEYKYVDFADRNDYLYDEIIRVKNDVGNGDINLFHKTR